MLAMNLTSNRDSVAKRSLGTGRRFHCAPDQENTLIFRFNQIRMQSKPYRTWPVPRVLSFPSGFEFYVSFYDGKVPKQRVK